MNRVLLILMIALLPLRTWAGDVMAIQMAAPVGFAQTAAANDSAAVGHEMQAAEGDCPGHSSMALVAESKKSPQSHCSTCGTCQICHSVAIVVSTPVLMRLPTFVQAPALDTPRFTSAEPALSQKPPIS